jgi:NADPH2:quinone reductase
MKNAWGERKSAERAGAKATNQDKLPPAVTSGRADAMKAMVCGAFGGPEVLALREVPDPPPPGPGDVQVRIRARGVQYRDALMLAGKYQFRPEPPFIPGSEAAGEVVAVGAGVSRFEVGDKVVGRSQLGALAELVNAKETDCDPMPSGLGEPLSGPCTLT